MPSGDDIVEDSLEELRALGKEVGERMREASSDTKRGWEKLKPKLQKAEAKLADKATEAGHDLDDAADEVIADVKRRLLELKAKL